MSLLALAPGKLVYLAGWLVIGGSVGALVGRWRNRLPAGVLAGLLLGPLGWLWIASLPGRFQECPSCSRPIPVQAARCPKCGADVARERNRSERSNLKRGGSGRR